MYNITFPSIHFKHMFSLLFYIQVHYTCSILLRLFFFVFNFILTLYTINIYIVYKMYILYMAYTM